MIIYYKFQSKTHLIAKHCFGIALYIFQLFLNGYRFFVIVYSSHVLFVALRYRMMTLAGMEHGGLDSFSLPVCPSLQQYLFYPLLENCLVNIFSYILLKKKCMCGDDECMKYQYNNILQNLFGI